MTPDRPAKNLRIRVGIGLAALLPTLLMAVLATAQPAVPTARPAASTSATATSAPATSAAATSAAKPAEPAPPAKEFPEEAKKLKKTRDQIRELVAGTLESGVLPQTLFDQKLDDEPGMALEARRLGLVLRAIELEEKRRDEATKRAQEQATERATQDAGAGGEPADAATPPEQPELDPLLLGEGVDPQVWSAQLDLDRERVAFYRLSSEARAKILDAHSAKQDALAVAEKDLDEAERKADQAEAEQQRALQAAASARSEALRAVGEELARLLGVAKKQADFEATLVRARKEGATASEGTLAWQRRVRETIESLGATRDVSPEIDKLYDELRRELHTARERLDASLERLGTPSSVPGAGEDRLAALPAEVEKKAATAQREKVVKESERLLQLERDGNIERAKIDYDQVVTLNKSRLALYDSLSATKRAAITGFGPAGVDQARAEFRQVALVLRYHFNATQRWVSSVRTSEGARGQSALAATILALKWLLPIALFIAWRRRAKPLLDQWQESLRTERRAAREVAPAPAERALAFFRRIRTPAEWLVLLLSVLWLLPAEAQLLLEVQLFRVIVVWAVGGSLAILTLDAIAQESSRDARKSKLQTAHIRLRSLRLIGRIVVAVGLLLALTDKLVGNGTIHSWVFSTCWYAAFPIGLLLVSWWRAVIFERIELKRKKNGFDRWILAQKSRPGMLVGSILGGSYLLGVGTYRFVRTWISTFEATRRVLAYLFRRDISKRSEQLSKLELGKLPDTVYAELGPEAMPDDLVASIADQQADEIIKRINQAGGGVFAVVGERGSGKSTLLEKIRHKSDDVVLVQCPFGGLAELESNIVLAGGKDAKSFAGVIAELDTRGREAGLIIDDAHRLISPMMGGLKEFDRILDVARRNSSHCAWVFAFDEILWRFVQRARGARPLFDNVIHLDAWREEGIARLLSSRARLAKATPSFEHLLEELPKDADEIDRQEALDRAQTNYYRLIWDYSAGNPGVALHTWRRCLGTDTRGGYAVRGFHAPDVTELEDLPDSAVFVLRAVLQLEQALLDDIQRATMLRGAAVEDALRFGIARGYFHKVGDRYRVTWAWYRPIHRFLQRRHLVFSGS